MKTLNLMNLPRWIGSIGVAVMTATGAAEPPAMRDAATHQQLVEGMRQAKQNDPMKNLPLSKVADPLVANPRRSLLAESDVISFGGLATLIPKRAILQIPKNFSQRLKLEDGVRLVNWLEFYATNRGWITTVEISREQAEGTVALPVETRKMMSKCRNLVVATYLAGPISLLPAKEPPAKEPNTKPSTPAL
ncbi:MAG: hypothetical protein WCJ14_09195 [Verrucomicrobiota bacterium]